jgi:hypothetical protein
MIPAVLLVLAFIVLAVGPVMWVRWTLAAHDTERADFPGTGGELAEHLIAELGLDGVKVEKTDRGDHYDMDARMVRLVSKHLSGKSVTAAAVAAHEVGHALQHRDGYGPLAARHRMVKHAIFIQRVGSVVLMASPLIFALTRAPSLLLFPDRGGTRDPWHDRRHPRRNSADRVRRELQTCAADPRTLLARRGHAGRAERAPRRGVHLCRGGARHPARRDALAAAVEILRCMQV